MLTILFTVNSEKYFFFFFFDLYTNVIVLPSILNGQDDLVPVWIPPHTHKMEMPFRIKPQMGVTLYRTSMECKVSSRCKIIVGLNSAASCIWKNKLLLLTVCLISFSIGLPYLWHLSLPLTPQKILKSQTDKRLIIVAKLIKWSTSISAVTL